MSAQDRADARWAEGRHQIRKDHGKRLLDALIRRLIREGKVAGQVIGGKGYELDAKSFREYFDGGHASEPDRAELRYAVGPWDLEEQE